MIIQQIILRLKTTPPLSEHGNVLRGYIANQFPHYDILHNHREDGSLLYLYPRIQYRTINGEGYIIGIEEGVLVIREIEPMIDTLNLKDRNYSILQKQLVSEDVSFGLSETPITYCFIKPWLALNEQNYHEYMKTGDQKEKKTILKKILIGNFMSSAKSLGYIVDRQIEIALLKLEERECFLKGTPMLGFLGTFSVNFEIPDYWGIGKSVSRGFGTVVRQKTEKGKNET
jgi:hypothetical protein